MDSDRIGLPLPLLSSLHPLGGNGNGDVTNGFDGLVGAFMIGEEPLRMTSTMLVISSHAILPSFGVAVTRNRQPLFVSMMNMSLPDVFGNAAIISPYLTMLMMYDV